MKNLLRFTLMGFVATMVVALCVPVGAQEQGRPDPTGQGRYLQFGNSVPYPGARVLRQAPAGATCQPAGELVGVRMWNSTGEGRAILSELSDKAMVLVTAEGTFLCGCAGGYNQLFLDKTPLPPQATQPPQRAQAQPPATVPSDVYVHVNGRVDVVHSGEVAVVGQQYYYPAQQQQVYYQQPAPALTLGMNWVWGGGGGGGCSSRNVNNNTNTNTVYVNGGGQNYSRPNSGVNGGVVGNGGVNGGFLGGNGGANSGVTSGVY